MTGSRSTTPRSATWLSNQKLSLVAVMTNSPAFLAGLTRLFQEGHSLVCWSDADGEFSTQVDAIDIEDVEILRLDRTPALQAKIWIERRAGVRWLVYAPFEEPEPI